LYIRDPNNWGGSVQTNLDRLNWADVRRDISGADDWNDATFNVPSGFLSVPGVFKVVDGVYLDGYGGVTDRFGFMDGTIQSDLTVTVFIEEIPVDPCIEAADLSVIESAIADAKAIRGSYTPDSWAAFQSAIAALSAKLASREWTVCDDLNAEFGALLSDLQTAQDALWRNDCGLGQGQWFNANNGVAWPGAIEMGGYFYTEAEGKAINNVNGSPVAARVFRAYAIYKLNVSAEFIAPADDAASLADVALVENWLSGLGQKLSPAFLPDPNGNSPEANAAQAARNAANNLSSRSKCFNQNGN
jgi:hypothetical protein